MSKCDVLISLIFKHFVWRLLFSVVDPNTLNLDPDPGFWPNLDPDPGPDPNPGGIVPGFNFREK